MTFLSPLLLLFAGQSGIAVINFAVVVLYSSFLEPQIVGQVGQLLLVQNFLITIIVNPIERFSEKYTFIDRTFDYKIINATSLALLTVLIVPIYYWLALSGIYSILSIIFLFFFVSFSILVRPFNIQLNRLKFRGEFILWRSLEAFTRFIVLFGCLIFFGESSIESVFFASIFSIFVVFFSQLRWSASNYLYCNFLPRNEPFHLSRFFSPTIGAYFILLILNLSYWGFFTYLPFHISYHSGFVESGKFSVAFHGIFLPMLFMFSVIYLFISPHIIDGAHKNFKKINWILFNSGFVIVIEILLYAIHQAEFFDLMAHWFFGNLTKDDGWILYQLAAASVFFMGSQIPLLLGLAEGFMRQLSALSVLNAVIWATYTFFSDYGSIQFVTETLVYFCFSCVFVGWFGVYALKRH